LPVGNWYYTSQPNLVVGELGSANDPSATYFVIANKDVTNTSAMTFTISRPVKVVETVNRSTGALTPLPFSTSGGVTTINTMLGLGDGVVLRVATIL
jgi:hypothetical protein